ncbi:hypothetical protein F5884DRAFT_12088 [Xylogone sp. PMI_703]|nr:hypothetical protein F5884DRAFT_12088 [Xylogone sp. PMI_703]
MRPVEALAPSPQGRSVMRLLLHNAHREQPRRSTVAGVLLLLPAGNSPAAALHLCCRARCRYSFLPVPRCTSHQPLPSCPPLVDGGMQDSSGSQGHMGAAWALQRHDLPYRVRQAGSNGSCSLGVAGHHRPALSGRICAAMQCPTHAQTQRA